MQRNKLPTILRLTTNHASELRDLRVQLVRENPGIYGVLDETEKKKTVDMFRKQIQEHNTSTSAIFALRRDAELIGMIKVEQNDTTVKSVGYIGSLGVLKRYQGRGYGQMLLDHTLAWISHNTQFKKVIAISVKTNKNSITFFKKNGFTIMKEDTYRGVPELYLEKLLDNKR